MGRWEGFCFLGSSFAIKGVNLLLCFALEGDVAGGLKPNCRKRTPRVRLHLPVEVHPPLWPKDFEEGLSRDAVQNSPTSMMAVNCWQALFLLAFRSHDEMQGNHSPPRSFPSEAEC